MSHLVSLRPIRLEDEEFLLQVYASTRAHEMALVPWDAAQKEAFLRQQFTLQHRFYIEQFPHASFEIILLGDQPVGRLYVDRGKDDILIIDIAVLPQFQSGIGAALIRDINAEADRNGKVVTGTVERCNRAMLLFRRLGYEATEENELFLSVRRRPRSAPAQGASACAAGSGS